MQRKENLNHKDLCYKVVFQKLLLFYKVSLHFALCAAVFFVAFARQCHKVLYRVSKVQKLTIDSLAF